MAISMGMDIILDDNVIYFKVSLKKQAFSGMIWTFVEMFGGQLINFFVNIILARKLLPEDYGLLGMIFVFITLSNTLMDSGVTLSILRSKEPKEEDYSTLFASNLFLSVFLYLILFILAPYIADFYKKEIVSDLIRVYGVTIIIQAFVQVQSVYLIKNLNFKKQTLMKLPSIIISSAIAIVMAYTGYGVWSLVFMYLVQNFLWALFHWIFGDWNPIFRFQKEIFKQHFGYGYRLTIVELINNITANIYQIVIGKFYSPNLVGYYTQSLTLRQVPMTNIYGAAIKVLFPIFSKIQDDKEILAMNFYRCQKLLMLILFPILLFMIFNAEFILVVLFSEKWQHATIYLQILSFNVLVNWNLAIVKIISHAQKILKIEIVLKILLFLMIGLSLILKRDIIYLLLCIPIFAIINYLVYSFTLSKLLNQNKFKGVLLTIRFFFIAFVPAIIVLFINKFIRIESIFYLLIINAVSYFFLYLILVYFMNKSLIKFLFLTLKLK